MTRSAATPSAGLAVTPELPSEPPHSIARQILEAGCWDRRHALASRICLAMECGGSDGARDPAFFLDVQHSGPVRYGWLDPAGWRAISRSTQERQLAGFDQMLSLGALAP